MSINSLTNLINQTVPYAWDNSLSMMEFLGKIVASMNEVIALVNEKLPDDFETKFYATFRNYTTEEMNRIVANGQFQTILTNILSGVTEFQNEITAARAGKPSLSERFNAVTNSMTEITVNVKTYGAVGNGIANDTTAFQQAFNVPGAKRVLIPAGSYLLNDTISMLSDTIVDFVGTVLEKTVGKPLFFANAKNNITINRPAITGDGAAETFVVGQETIKFDSCTNLKVKDGTFKEIKGRNAILFFECDGIEASGNTIDKYSYGGISCLQGCKNIRIFNNKVLNCTNNVSPNIYPIMLSGYDGSEPGYPMAENIWCYGNYIDNITPYWEGIDAHGGKNIHVYDNIIKGSYIGIALLSLADSTWYVQDLFVHNNHCIAPTTGGGRNISNNGIAVTGATGKKLNAHIHHNTLVDFGKLTTSITDLGSIKIGSADGVRIDSNNFINSKGFGLKVAADCKNVEIKNNLFDGVEGVGAFGIHFDNTGHQAIIEGNTFKNMENAIRQQVSSTDPASSLIRLRNNVVDPAVLYNTVGLYCIPDKSTNPTSNGIKVGRVGDIIYNIAPAVGSPRGWVCTVAGNGTTPGTWVSIGNLV